MTEPSNAERAIWPDVTKDYVFALEQETKKMRTVLEYFADENNWNVDPDSSYIEMKRPGGGYQKGIVLVSHNLRPWILAQGALGL